MWLPFLNFDKKFAEFTELWPSVFWIVLERSHTHKTRNYQARTILRDLDDKFLGFGWLKTILLLLTADVDFN
jgi:hypothetical protein